MHRLRPFLALLFALSSFAASAGEARPVRLYEVFALRITVDETGFHTLHRGRLNALGQFTEFELGALPPGVVPPPEAMNRTLITVPTLYAYEVLGPEALANFDCGTTVITIGVQGYVTIAAADDAKFDIGELLNVSTRATVTPGQDPVIAGFVVDAHYRWVLIRGIGPTLAGLGVTNPLPDPYITVYRQGSNQAFAFNDDWAQRFDADEIERVSAVIGAFPLSRGSKDAAYLLELPPGAYTVHLTAIGTTGGTALVEVYLVP